MDPEPTTERRLQPLRIPSGFKIEWNEFYAYDPSTEYDEKDHLHYLTEELLQLKYHQEELVVDLGWYGDTSRREGYFQLLLLRGLRWEEPLVRITSPSLTQITDKLEDLIWKIHDRPT
jgi:hypothetical protein